VYEVRAQIVGTVIHVAVAAGDTVQPGAEIAVLESMKMQIPVEASRGGRVHAVHVNTGDVVQEGDLVVTLLAERE
jgi:acetyl-CoA carboxylase biotin carboxyl carrier protein